MKKVEFVLSTDRMAQSVSDQTFKDCSQTREEQVKNAFKASGKLYTGKDMGGEATAFWQSGRGKIKMSEMDNDYLQRAFENICYSELQLNNAMEYQIKTKDKLLKEAYSRGIELKYPDEVKQKKFGIFFEAERCIRKVFQFLHERQELMKALNENTENFKRKSEELRNKFETRKNQSV